MAAIQQDALKKQADNERLRARFDALDACRPRAMMDASLAPAVYLSATQVKP